MANELPQGSVEFVAAEYTSLNSLEIRQFTHRHFSVPVDDVESFTLDVTDLPEYITMLDIGPGTGSFLRRLAALRRRAALFAVDLSATAALAANGVSGAEAVQGDACALPFGESTFDAVFARHMLYHVADLPTALREAHRVTKPGGQFVVVVNIPTQIPRVNALLEETVRRFGAVPSSPTPVNSEGVRPELEKLFCDIHIHPFLGSLRFDRPEPLARFAVSLLTFFGVTQQSSIHDAVAAEIAARVAAWFDDQHGPWVDDKGYVVFVARKG